MVKKKNESVPADKLALYEKLVATNPKATLKGDKMPYTSHQGHMFSNLDEEGHLHLRLPKEEIEPFLKKYKTTLATAHGLVRKEYVLVPDALLAKTKELKSWFDKSYDFVNSLKPKPTKK
jgi:TfoX/Sxy family transcriptional regulator of competence genes